MNNYELPTIKEQYEMKRGWTKKPVDGFNPLEHEGVTVAVEHSILAGHSATGSSVLHVSVPVEHCGSYADAFDYALDYVYEKDLNTDQDGGEVDIDYGYCDVVALNGRG